jgi:hypothetical protein
LPPRPLGPPTCRCGRPRRRPQASTTVDPYDRGGGEPIHAGGDGDAGLLHQCQARGPVVAIGCHAPTSSQWIAALCVRAHRLPLRVHRPARPRAPVLEVSDLRHDADAPLLVTR